ncbi:response regulator [Paenibacillus whitsoniae]|uniref:Response regulator n=1 Tax=Paenibacillus whitsoniae TaxID=2496558 RepID=A0A3S0AM18_9BACL|nr:response regulator [Paenibacillus whitsoniae]RTE06673.1 response regulator [Paenibacillus whitsoniae]
MKIFLIDDEKGLVEGLTKLIGRYIPECEVVGHAYNGVEGAALIMENQPDIVLTDIRMPQADGLDMIQSLKNQGCRSKFIILSGYADFEYARKGIQLGVQFYLNKPVEEDELRDCVYRVMAAIHEERAKAREVDTLKQEVHSRLMESLLRDLLDAGGDPSDHEEELLRLTGIPHDKMKYVCALLEFERYAYGALPSSSAFKESELEPVYLQIDQVLEQYNGVYRFRYAPTQLAVMVMQRDSMLTIDELHHSFDRLKETLHREQKLNVTIGIGTVQGSAAGISTSFEEARHALSYMLINGKGSVIPYSEVLHVVKRRLPVPEETLVKLESNLDKMDEPGCIAVIQDIFRQMSVEHGLSPADFKMQCLNILLSSIRQMSFQPWQMDDFLGRHIPSLDEMSKFRTLTELEAWMIEVVRAILALKQEFNIPQKKDVIAEIKDYVAAHYSESISLAELSARFFLNPYYLSQLFKQKTGDTYLNYLAQIRVNKSKELLEKTDLKVYEICEKVGYTDTQYFSRLFEKMTGVKPSEYRKNLYRS